MIPELSPLEARVVGCLMEKEVTTPDQYPLSLNALTAACNQKSNRDPVMRLSPAEVQATVDGLMKKHHVTDRAGFGSRVVKYSHRFCNTQFSQIQLSKGGYAVVCELLLRGPQTPGELRTHASRLHPFRDVGEIEAVLAELAGGEDPMVVQLPRQPGRRESRWAQLFTGPPEPGEEAAAPGGPPAADAGEPPDLLERIAALEAAVAALTRRLDALGAQPQGHEPGPADD